MTDKTKDAFVEALLDRLSLDEKIGATLTLHCRGSVFHPIYEDAIRTHNVGGLRLDPSIRYQEN